MIYFMTWNVYLHACNLSKSNVQGFAFYQLIYKWKSKSQIRSYFWAKNIIIIINK